MMRLVIDSVETEMTAGYTLRLSEEYSLRFVESEKGPAYPVLYKEGRRVTKGWLLEMSHECPPDSHGGNANTA
jgi:hypothetical protein